MSSFDEITKGQLSRLDPSFIQEGIIKDNRDPKKMGRLKVWIIGSPSAEDNKNGWITCDYASPFSGRTTGSPNAKQFKEYPKSYGFWAVPPDIGSRVFIFFINGRLDQSYWFSSPIDFMMNNNIPGPLTKVPVNSLTSAKLPVTEYDRNTQSSDIQGEYPNVPLIDGLQRQMLLYDDELGTPNKSGRRQAPNMIYGLSSPRGNHIVLDDGYLDTELNSPTWDDDQNGYQNTEYGNPTADTETGSRKAEGIILRTRSGAQINISESTGEIFIINRDGTGRVVMDTDGNISVLGSRDISLRAKRDINFLAERDLNVDVLGGFNLRVQGDWKQEISSNISLLCNGTRKTDIKGDNLVNIQGISSLKCNTLKLESTSTSLRSSGALKMTAGGGSLTLNSNLNLSSSFYAQGNISTSKNNLDSHQHIHGDPKTGAPTNETGSGASVSAADSANSVAVDSLVENSYLDVVDVNPDNNINKIILNELGKRTEASLTTLCFLMPTTGRIRTTGYWGPNIKQDDGSILNQSGWMIDGKDVISSPFDGVIRYTDTNIIQIDHMNGYVTIYKGIEVDLNKKYKPGMKIRINEEFGKFDGTFLFEVRKSGASIFGFDGTLDPGLFYKEKTGTGFEASGKELTRGEPTNPVCMIVNPDLSTSSELVKTTGVNSIVSTLPLSGSLNQPGQTGFSQTSTVSQAGRASTSAVQLPDEQDEIVSDPAPVDWVVEATDPDLNKDIKNDEGPIPYQTKRGYFRNGKFHVYLDSRGFPTIGYGHLVTSGENYTNGLTESEGDTLLSKDLIKHVNGAKSIAATYNMRIPRVAQLVLVEMVFQLGKGGAMKFKNFMRCLAQGKYRTAASHLRDSAWYKQTTNRVEKHCRRLESLGGG